MRKISSMVLAIAVFLLAFQFTQPISTLAAANDPTVSSIFLTDANGNLLDNPSDGTYVVPNVCVNNNNSTPASQAVNGTLIFAAYNAGEVLKSISYVSVNQNISKDGYSGSGFNYAAGDTLKVFLWDGLGSIKPLTAPNGYEPVQSFVMNFPSDFEQLPFTITRTGKRTYTHNATPENQYDWSDATEVFISCTVSNSITSRTGTDTSLPINVKVFSDRVIAGNYYYRSDGTTTQKKFIVTIKDDIYTDTNLLSIYPSNLNVLVRSGAPSGFTWMARYLKGTEISTAWAADSGVYKLVQNSTTRVILTAVNYNALDSYGMPKPYNQVYSLQECQATSGTFYQNAANIYCNPFSGENITDVKLVLSQKLLDCQNCASGQTIMFKNIGILPSVINIDSKITGTDVTSKIYFFNCKFFRGKSNAIAFDGTYKAYVFDSIAAYAAQDGFNFHGNTSCFATDINCTSYGNGQYEFNGSTPDLVSDNCSTGHDGIKMLRVGGRYRNSQGPIVGDAIDCYAISLGCEAQDQLTTTTGIRAAFLEYNDAVAPPVHKKYIIDCYGAGTNLLYGIQGTPETYYANFEGLQNYTGGIVPINWTKIMSGQW